MKRVADLVIARPKAVLGLCLLLLVIGGAYGRDTAGRLSPAGYEVGGSDSTRALAVLADEFDTGPANLVVLVSTNAGGGVDEAEVVQQGQRLGDRLLAMSDVGDVTSYWSTGAPQLKSTDGTQAIIAARIVASEEEIYGRVEEIRSEFAGSADGVDVRIGGSAAANLEIVEESEADLLRAELIAIPLTTIIMLFVFRSVVAALLPLIVSAVAVIGTAVALKALSEVTLVSIFALNLTTALGLGMGVDFSLFTLSRWREERDGGADNETALRTTIDRAGRSILFSGLTTAATLAALLVFDYPLLRSLAVAGFVVVILAVVGALLALPAAISLLGDRVDKFQIRRATPKPIESGFFYRVAQRVMARPRTTIVVVAGGLLVLGAPFLRAEFGIPDDRALPTTSQSRQVADVLRANFDGSEFGALAAVVSSAGGAQSSEGSPNLMTTGQQFSYAAAVSSIAGVAKVESAAGVFRRGELVGSSLEPRRFVADTGVWFSIIPSIEPISLEAENMVTAVRELPTVAPVLLGGESARLVDNKAEIAGKLAFVGLWVFVVVGLLLYRSFRSILLPIKAVLLNLLSLTSAFGAVVWIFQDGRLTGLLGFTPTGLTDAQTPVLIFCIAFGLSMDYEVFLLSRIKEEWDRTGDAERSVAVGLQRTGRIITAAAVLMAVVFLSFASGHVTFIQMVGIGLALSILADAILVRTFLVPAVMAVAGRWNWWSPSPGWWERPAVGRAGRNQTTGNTNDGGN